MPMVNWADINFYDFFLLSSVWLVQWAGTGVLSSGGECNFDVTSVTPPLRSASGSLLVLWIYTACEEDDNSSVRYVGI